MARPTRHSTPATYDDLRGVPDHLVAEIIEGELYTTPRPSPRHAAAGTAIGGFLHGPFDAGRRGPGGWRILFEPELHLGHDVVVPDIAGWRRQRMPHLPDEAFVSLTPDWACEVLSPSTAALDRVQKLAIYHREGVAYVWLVDPIARTLEVLQASGGAWTLVRTAAGASTVQAEPFDALPLDLTLLWDEPAPNEAP